MYVKQWLTFYSPVKQCVFCCCLRVDTWLAGHDTAARSGRARPRGLRASHGGAQGQPDGTVSHTHGSEGAMLRMVSTRVMLMYVLQTMNKKRQSALKLASVNGHESVVEFLQTLEPVLQVVQLQGLRMEGAWAKHQGLFDMHLHSSTLSVCNRR